MNQTCLSVRPSLTALHVFRRPDRGEASGGPPGPRRPLPAAFRQPVVQSHLLVDEHLHYLRPQATHRPQSHRQTAHRNESPHQLHEATQGL